LLSLLVKTYDFIKPPENPEALAALGGNAFDAASEYLVRSPYWEITVNGTPMPVLALPVTRGGLHSFVSVPFSEGLCVEAVPLDRTAESASLSPLRLNTPHELTDSCIRFFPAEASHYCLQLNGDFENPLTVSIQPPVKKNIAGDLVFEPGIHYIDTITLQSHQTLIIQEGAVVKALPPSSDETPTCEKDWAGKKNYRPAIEACGVKNITVTGGGILDLSGLDWHDRSPMAFRECENVTVEGITIIGTPLWNLIIDRCKNVHINNVRLYGHRENSDGIDIVSSQDILVENCFLRTGDDAICVKAMQPAPVCGGRNILVQNCVIWNDKVRCLGITSETQNDIEQVRFRQCDIVRSFPTWTEEIGSLCVIVCDRGTASHISFEDIFIEHEVHYVMNCQIMKDRWSSQPEIGHIRDVTFRNIHAPKGIPSRFVGYDKEHMVRNVLIDGYFYNEGQSPQSPETTQVFAENIVVRRNDL